jgi:hypothetical protein
MRCARQYKTFCAIEFLCEGKGGTGSSPPHPGAFYNSFFIRVGGVLLIILI